MSHSNIHERRRFVRQVLAGGSSIPRPKRVEIAKRFNCSESAVHADLVAILHGGRHQPTRHPTVMRKAIVHWRDGGECQYCHCKSTEMIIEHVIPASIGGRAVLSNLVLACQSCNSLKSNKVWVPANLFGITSGFRDAASRLIQLAVSNPTGIALDENVHKSCIIETCQRTASAKLFWKIEQPQTMEGRQQTIAAFEKFHRRNDQQFPKSQAE